MNLPKHTPYRNGNGGVKVGLEPINESDWLELDNLFNSEIKLKKELYKSHSEQIHQELNQSIESKIDFSVISLIFNLSILTHKASSFNL